MKKAELEWYAFRYDSNEHKIKFINVLSGMEEEIIKKVKKGAKDKWKPVTDYNSFKDYIKGDLMYYYWSKAEHETVIGGLFNFSEEDLEKHDIWWQLEPNLDRICEYIIDKLKINIGDKNERNNILV